MNRYNKKGRRLRKDTSYGIAIVFLAAIGSFMIGWTKYEARYELKVGGWDHGVVLCRAGTVIVFMGHENDPEVEELMSLVKGCKDIK